jgi:hypothetical protein
MAACCVSGLRILSIEEVSMATGRTVARWARLYMDGYDVSGHTRSIGPLSQVFDEAEIFCLSESVKGALPDTCTIGVGDVSMVLDNTATSGSHTLFSGAAGAGIAHKIMIPIGIRAAPAQGDPVFVAQLDGLSYQMVLEDKLVTASMAFGLNDPTIALSYSKCWGYLLNTLTARTGANTGTGVDCGVVSPARGGYLMYQISAYATTGSATISIDDSANNADWIALDGATSGAIAHTSMPCAGIIKLTVGATVRQYLRWQLSLTTLTTCTFALAWIPG